jgi:hypothetical protein
VAQIGELDRLDKPVAEVRLAAIRAVRLLVARVKPQLSCKCGRSMP